MAADSLPDGRASADLAGLVASIACAIHCAAMPLVIGYLPMLGLSWLADESFHRVMAVVCFALALSAFLPGWKRHGSLAPALFGSIGVGLLSAAAFGLEGECCPSCAAAKPSKVSLAVSSEPFSACTDAGCVHCADKEVPAQPVTVEASASLVAWAIPFITPIGGVFLVAGHVCNHRQSSACCDAACCSGGTGEDRSGESV